MAATSLARVRRDWNHANPSSISGRNAFLSSKSAMSSMSAPAINVLGLAEANTTDVMAGLG